MSRVEDVAREALWSEITGTRWGAAMAAAAISGEEVKIGKGQSQRAEALGVERRTIQNWDRESRSDGKNFASAPTHQRLANGRIEPLAKHPRLATPTPPATKPLDISKNRNRHRAEAQVHRLEAALANIRFGMGGSADPPILLLPFGRPPRRIRSRASARLSAPAGPATAS